MLSCTQVGLDAPCNQPDNDENAASKGNGLERYQNGEELLVRDEEEAREGAAFAVQVVRQGLLAALQVALERAQILKAVVRLGQSKRLVNDLVQLG